MAVVRTLVSLAVTAMLLFSVAMATNYTVGGPNGGWDMSTNIQSWASSQSFSVGDDLLFQYMTNHNVLEVTKADHDSCQTSNPIQTYSGGNTVVPLTSPGKRYFICGSMGHCSQGMKVEVDTLASQASPPSIATPPTPSIASPFPPPESETQPTMSSPIPAPTMSPLSPVSSLASPYHVPSTEPLANSPPNGFAPPHPSSSATKIHTLVGYSVGFSFAVAILLTL
ncbi:unnamed protein product [Camellia sinensis]